MWESGDKVPCILILDIRGFGRFPPVLKPAARHSDLKKTIYQRDN